MSLKGAVPKSGHVTITKIEHLHTEHTESVTVKSSSHHGLLLLFVIICITVWLGGRVVREPDLQSTGRRFESRPPR